MLNLGKGYFHGFELYINTCQAYITFYARDCGK